MEADRLVFEANQSLQRAVNSNESGALGGEGAQHSTAAANALCKAATQWRTRDQVVDRQGPLHEACATLKRLGRADGVVKVALACAHNFTGIVLTRDHTRAVELRT